MSITQILLFIVLFIVFIIIAYFSYNSYMKKRATNPNSEYIKNDRSGELMLFYAAWCPYSQTTMKQWYTYKEKYNGPYKISFSEIDCDENPSLADNYSIDSYPTIILLLNDKKYIFDAQMSDETLTEFINTIMK